MSTIHNSANDPLAIPLEFSDIFALQQSAYRQQMNPTLAERRADLLTLHRMLVENRETLVEAVNKDFGCRCKFETRFTEIFLNQDAILATVKQLKKWMKPQKRHLDPTQYPLAKAWTFPQPVGVVGIVVPWNFPIGMAITPLIGIFAAGSRAMIKMSENSNHQGGDGQCRQKPDPGDPRAGRQVALRGRPDFPIRTAAERILWAKMLNSGQICTNVDYLFLEEFIREARAVFNARAPDVNNGDYTAVIDQRSYDRLQATVADAAAKGARVVDLYTGPVPDATRRLMPTRIVIDVNDDMDIMQREIFGPLLPIRTYKTREEVVQYIGDRPRPLAFYIYSNDKALQDYYLNHTISGGLGINESVIQAGIHDLPFGGSGNSGMGHYHGYEGFFTVSKLRPVFKQGPLRALSLFQPPYRGLPSRILAFMLKRKS